MYRLSIHALLVLDNKLDVCNESILKKNRKKSEQFQNSIVASPKWTESITVTHIKMTTHSSESEDIRCIFVFYGFVNKEISMPTKILNFMVFFIKK